jgi:cell division protein FtsW
LLLLVFFLGDEAKGAKRWIMIFGFAIQPSEFAKTFFLVFNALLLHKLSSTKWFIKYGLSTSFYLATTFLLILQPDFGMSLVFTALWLIQLFVFGLPLLLIALCIFLGLIGAISAYFMMPHVADRVNKFLNFNQSNYQVERSVDAYVNGGFFGTGPGSGIVKQHIPDAHTDFIFAVIGEEFGLIFCLFLMLILVLIITRAMKYALNEKDLFSKLAVIGIISQIALQSLINIGVSIGMLPTKGMTLPFISYGGSSLLAVSIGFGVILSLTKKKYDNKINYDNISLG